MVLDPVGVGAGEWRLKNAASLLSAAPPDIVRVNLAEAEALLGLGGSEQGVDSPGRSDLEQRVRAARTLAAKLGCAVLLKAMEQQPEYDTWFVFSVLEESGGFGARTASLRIQPDLAIVVDTTTSADHIEKPEAAKASRLGEGAVVFLMEATTYYKPESVARVTEIANRAGVKWQYKTVTKGGLNSGSIQRTGRGCETVAIATPCRYLHSAACTIKLDDACETAALLHALLQSREL